MFAARTGTPFALSGAARDDDGRSQVRRDAIHRTPEGHAYAAGRLLDAGIADWTQAILLAESLA